MNRAQLVDVLAGKTGFAKKDVERLVELLESTVTEKLRAGEEVTLAGFGEFSARDRKGRRGVNPRKLEQVIQIPTVRVPKFKAGKNLKEAVRR